MTAAPGARLAGTLVAMTLLAGCTGPTVVAPLGRAPERGVQAPAQGVHRVESGETLYAIAWRYGLDYRELARWNAIPEPFTIHKGQLLRISRPAVIPEPPRPSVAAAPAVEPREPTPREGRAAPAPRQSSRRAAPPPPRDDRAVSAWRWPARGKLVGTFGRSGGKGIDIAGTRGAAVVAAAAGRVVYSGSGLRGYGKLIIVKHNKRYLSAYAHNDHLHVREGETVKSGQRIADMGSTDARTVKLHFEIRRDGRPVDPTRFLPR